MRASASTRPDAPTTARTPISPNVHEMLVIHRVFRREFAAFPALVRQVHDGDVRRAKVVGGHVRLILAGLHMHHVGEDEVLWPRLLDRAAPSQELVRTMEQQHEDVDVHVNGLSSDLDRWIAGGSAAVGEKVATRLDGLAGALFAHLDLEERETLPLIEQNITAAEWATLSEHGRDSMSASQLPLMFGAILEDATEDERAELLAPLPAPVRFLMRGWGTRKYRRYITRVRAS